MKLLLPILAATVASCTSGTASTIFTEGVMLRYDAPAGNEFAPTFSAGSFSGSSLNLGTSTANLEAGLAIPGTVFLNPSMASPTPLDAFLNDQYLEFTISSTDGRLFQPLTLSFLAANGGSSGPRGWSLRSSADGFAVDLGSSVVGSQAPAAQDFTVTLNGFSPIAENITFRIYGYSPAAGQGLFFDEIELYGAMEVIPELHPGGLLAAGLAMVLLRRQRGRP